MFVVVLWVLVYSIILVLFEDEENEHHNRKSSLTSSTIKQTKGEKPAHRAHARGGGGCERVVGTVVAILTVIVNRPPRRSCPPVPPKKYQHRPHRLVTFLDPFGLLLLPAYSYREKLPKTQRRRMTVRSITKVVSIWEEKDFRFWCCNNKIRSTPGWVA